MQATAESGTALDPRDASEVARQVGVPREAVELTRACEVIDLHLESFIPARLWGYDLLRRHRLPLGGFFFGHLDLPRALEGGLTGAMWSIATNIARPARERPEVLDRNMTALRDTLERSGRVAVVRSAAEYRQVRARGLHAAWICVQGANALEGAEDRVATIGGGTLTRVTIVHLSNSIYGDTSSPARLRRDRGLTAAGRALVERLNAARIFVDLAHAGPRTFWDVAEVADRAQPLIVTHTGACAVHRMWRNVEDAQIRRVADSGGVVGVIFHRGFLGRRVRDGRAVLDHLEAVIRAGGEGVAALGSDYDGFIIPPPDLRDGAKAYYRLVAYMLERKWSEARIRGVLGENYLRSFAALRP
jgi:membrane dipeptidase